MRKFEPATSAVRTLRPAPPQPLDGSTDPSAETNCCSGRPSAIGARMCTRPPTAAGLAALTTAALMMAAAGCADSTSSSGRPAATAWPEKLVVAYNVPEEPKERRASEERFRKLEEYLERTLKVDVVSRHSGDYTATIEAMRAEKVDICEVGAFSYVLAHQLAKAEPLVLRGTESKGPLTYHSVIIAPKDSPFSTLDEALAVADRLTLALEPPTSTSGHLVPRGYLDSIGVRPEEKFKSVVISTGFPASILTAIGGKVDLSCVNTAALSHLEDKGVIRRTDYRVLWRSPPMPREPIAIRGGLPEGFKTAVRDAYLNMRRDAPDTFALMSGSQDEDATFLPGDDRLYDYYRKIARGIAPMRLPE